MIGIAFIELPAFERKRPSLWSDNEYFAFQDYLAANPEAGDVIKDGGGLRKVRYRHAVRGKGKRSGVRVIYFWKRSSGEVLLFSIFSKDEKSNFSPGELKHLRSILEQFKDLQS